MKLIVPALMLSASQVVGLRVGGDDATSNNKLERKLVKQVSFDEGLNNKVLFHITKHLLKSKTIWYKEWGIK